MGIPAADVRDWADRLASAAPNPEGRRAPGSDHVDVPDWLERSRIVLRGARGLEELSNFGVTTAPVPDEFEASLLRVSVGEVMLFSTLETAHVVTYGGLADGPDIVIIGRESAGLQRLHRTATTSVEEMGVGRMGFMSSFAPSVVEHVGVTETTGVVLPTDLLGPVRDRLSGGVGLLPDTALTRRGSSSRVRCTTSSCEGRRGTARSKAPSSPSHAPRSHRPTEPPTAWPRPCGPPRWT
ncbi:MAG: hypothetical protein J0I70_14285 [Microbacterium sp.]|uniref:hypothetical protein n=1 Tax=Microbacterium sp. TaxID=51671 RepID=UPI001ACEE49F|nr:hypothetical protein [Microbacterium sp.]MBN9154013.1 hypothetical protein [Microbacterium sp.]MBN9175311.1 hypothetical protein [Microbacterium sp.]